ncbi:glycosyltransferase family 39 protein [Patescibacteria group bacterium]|nr:glycosyltransferase family 39 protein [Patescibacteria group bacterium]
MLRKIIKYFNKFHFEKLLLIIVLALSFIVRVYRVNDLLGFYYDQGRDALVIWDLWHNGKFFLIGPTTGIAGIFRGPYYYYLITPFYLLGGGNPVYPAVFLAFLSTLSIYLLYLLVEKIQKDKIVSLVAVVIASFSFNMVMASRWLSNPTPMFLLSMFLILGMFRVIDNKKYGWEIIALISGLSLFNFGSSGELYYFLAIFIFLLLNWKNRPDLKRLLISLFLFFLTFAPLLLFDLRHGGILRNNFFKSFVSEKSFTFPTESLFEARIVYYYEVFSKTLFHSRQKLEILLMSFLVLGFLFFAKDLWKNKYVKVVLIVLFSPIVGLLFFQGNDTVLYEYYMTGYLLIFILLVSLVLGKIWKNILGKLLVVLFVIVFLLNNIPVIRFKLKDKVDSTGSVALKNELQVVDWIFEDSEEKLFNVDIYVPPVISYAYDYLFKWKSFKGGFNNLKFENVDLLYTVYENDSQHPERLEAWLSRQKGIGDIIEENHFGGITIQKRIRI